jgi:hypothetical protein
VTPATGRQVRVSSTHPLDELEVLAEWARAHRIALPDLQVTRPSLEDVYLDLVEARA